MAWRFILEKKTSKKVGDVPLPCLFCCGLLFGGLEHEFYDFPYMVIITPTDFIFFRGVAQPPTRLWWCVMKN
jgi:hypothetical protein